MLKNFVRNLERDLQAPIEVRGFGSGWFAGFFALLFAICGFGMVLALRFPEWLAMPELKMLKDMPQFRVAVHAMLLASYALALLSLLLRPRKALGATALAIGLVAALLGGSNVQSSSDSQSWGIFFGLDFFIVNLLITGFMFAPIERFFPHRAEQRLFRIEWREDLFYYLISSMMVQAFTFLALAPQAYVNAHTSGWGDFRLWVAALPAPVQFVAIVVLSDLFQYWYHRLFHRVPFLWGFHAVHHSAPAMDWLAGARMHFVEVVLLRGVTSLPMFTLGFSPAVMQAYIGFVYVYSSLLHANLGGDFNRLGHWVATPRFHHWHHGLEQEAVDVNFAIHLPLFDKLFGTFHLPEGRWPKDYGVPEKVPAGYWAQMKYPFVRKQPQK
jgi:sterol desaturase/sphingolipid hydroxylase (fatty acid hydroxylase superfamily)